MTAINLLDTPNFPTNVRGTKISKYHKVQNLQKFDLCQPTKKMFSCLNYDNYADELCCMQLAKVNFSIKHWLWSAFSLTMILLSLNILACTQILVTRVNELECCNFYIQLLDSALNLEVRFWQSSWVCLLYTSPSPRDA